MLPHLPQSTPVLVLRSRRIINFYLSSVRPFSNHSSWLHSPGKPLLKWPPTAPPSNPNNPPPQIINNHYVEEEQQQLKQNDQIQTDSNTLCKLLKDPSLPDQSTLQSALNQTGVLPHPALIETVINSFDSSPSPSLMTLFLWANKHPYFHPTPLPLFNSIVLLLSKAREFHVAWSLLLDRLDTIDQNLSRASSETFTMLIRRYARSSMPQSAIRTFEFMEKLMSTEDTSFSDPNSNSDHFVILLDALCKEGHVNAAACYFQQRKSEPNLVASVRAYNVLLNGWFRSRKLRKAEQLWEQMQQDNVAPTNVTYGTVIEGCCRMGRVQKAIVLLEEMKTIGIEPNVIIYNPVIDALGEAGKFKDALGMLERMSVYGLSPTISTYNSLVKGFCKVGDLVGASKILKMMIARGRLPTATTYNYFFKFFAKFGKIKEGMNLYTKIIESGYEPDRLTYHLLIKMLCERDILDLAVQVNKEMNTRGCDSDLATSTMLLHLLCRMHRLEDACAEFEGMIKRGIVPQYLTYQKLTKELKKLGMLEMARKVSCLMGSVPHSTKLPDTYREEDGLQYKLRSSIMQKAKVMSDILKTCKDPRELTKRKGLSANVVASAYQLIEDIKRGVRAT